MLKKIQHTDILPFESEQSVWVVPIPQCASFISIDSLYDESKKLVNHSHTLKQEFDKVKIDFGIEEYKGYVKYSYVTYCEEEDSNNNQVVVNVNNCCEDDKKNNSNILSKTFNSDINIKVAELSAKALFIDYCLHSNSGIEVGRLTIIDHTEIKLDAERFFNNDLLDVSFSVNKDDEAINLQITGVEEEYTIEYKLLIF